MKIGSNVRMAIYSIAAGGIVYGDCGTITKMFAAVAFVDFGNGNVKKVCVSNLIMV